MKSRMSVKSSRRGADSGSIQPSWCSPYRLPCLVLTSICKRRGATKRLKSTRPRRRKGRRGRSRGGSSTGRCSSLAGPKGRPSGERRQLSSPARAAGVQRPHRSLVSAALIRVYSLLHGFPEAKCARKRSEMNFADVTRNAEGLVEDPEHRGADPVDPVVDRMSTDCSARTASRSLSAHSSSCTLVSAHGLVVARRAMPSAPPACCETLTRSSRVRKIVERECCDIGFRWRCRCARW